MSGDPKKERDGLDRLADALVDDLLDASDGDVLAEIIDERGNPETLAAGMRALFERTVLEAGKAKLAAARKAAAAASGESTNVPRIDRAEARSRYQRMVDDGRGMTLAARKGQQQSERDIESAIEDSAELGVFDKEDDGV